MSLVDKKIQSWKELLKKLAILQIPCPQCQVMNVLQLEQYRNQTELACRKCNQQLTISGIEFRRFLRYPKKQEIECQQDSRKRHKALLVDLSNHGLQCILSHKLNPNMLVYFISNQFTAKGKIMWHHPFKMNRDYFYRYGIEFITFKPLSKNILFSEKV